LLLIIKYFIIFIYSKFIYLYQDIDLFFKNLFIIYLLDLFIIYLLDLFIIYLFIKLIYYLIPAKLIEIYIIKLKNNKHEGTNNA